MLEFNVIGQRIRRSDSFQPAEKSVGYLKAKFNFLTDEWENVDTITLRAKNKADIIIHEADVVDGIATVPWEALDRSGSFMLSLFARAGDVEITTSSVEIELNPTLDSGISSKPPTPTELDEIRDDIKDLRDQIENMDNTVNDDELKTAVETALEEAKESGEFDGPKGDKGDPGKDGYTPVKGIDYFDGKDGEPGEDGKSAYQYALDSGYTGTEEEFAEKMAEEGCSGGMTVTDDGNGNVTIETSGEAGGASDPGSSNAVLYTPQTLTPEQQKQARDNVGAWPIIDVVELPTENIREDCFYRLLSGSFAHKQVVHSRWTCYCVEDLPETGEPAFSGDLSDSSSVVVTAYYKVTDGSVSAYVPAQLGPMFGVPEGWYPVATLMSAVGYEFAGVITNILDDPNDRKFRILLEYVTYDHKNGNWTSHKKIGWPGTGAGAEIFNHPGNVASGFCAHVEGSESTASGSNSHAEGEETTASGAWSHAEGYASHAEGSHSHAEGSHSHAEGYASHAEGGTSHAEGSHSHAEGSHSHAEGYASHAEGGTSHAEGRYSHAEGDTSHAVGRSQHVQGEYNLVDPEYNPDTPDVRAKYAHIVGNGNHDNDRSNAHTLDWEGNAWFAGTVEGTALILKSPNDTRFRITVGDDGVLSATAV